MNISERNLQLCREGMYAVVNEPGGTAPLARLGHGRHAARRKDRVEPGAPRLARAAGAAGNFKSENLPWEYRPHALFVAFAPYDSPRYAVSLVVEHGNAGCRRRRPRWRARSWSTCSPATR